MRILITNITLRGRSGTETYVKDLALALLRKGHQPVVYTPRPGLIAEELREKTIPVTDDLSRLSAPPDFIHGHHSLTTMEALLHFPKTPGLFVCHDRLAWHDAPPRFPRLIHYVAVDENCMERLVGEHGLPSSQISLIGNAVDLERFTPRPPLLSAPKRALIFSNEATQHNYAAAVRAACRNAGIAVDDLGEVMTGFHEKPEAVLHQYDLVFAKARCALEAMAVGCSVILCGTRGLGPMVTPHNVAALRRLNFGMRTLLDPVTEEAIGQRIGQYNASEARQVQSWIRQNAGLDGTVDAWIGLYQRLKETFDATAKPSCEQELEAAAGYLKMLDAALHRPQPVPLAKRLSRLIKQGIRKFLSRKLQAG